MKLFVNPGLSVHQGVSKEYDIRTSAAKSSNTFIFSEKDLPGYNKHRVKKGGDVKPDDKKDVLAASSQGGISKKSSMNTFNRRKAIPSMRLSMTFLSPYADMSTEQTAFAATITREVTCKPVDLETEASSRRIDAEDKNQMTILKGDVRQYARMVLAPGAGGQRGYQSSGNYDTFVSACSKTFQTMTNADICQKTDTGPAKPKPQETKTARMPQNELLDALYDCFKEYRYWSMTAFRQRLHQPEAYLRQTLLLIAEQVRSGQFNNQWKLRAEQELSNIDVSSLRAESAPQREGAEEAGGASSAPGTDNDNEDDDDDEDDLDMEDVM